MLVRRFKFRLLAVGTLITLLALLFSACTTAPAADVQSEAEVTSDAPAAEETETASTEAVAESGELWYEPVDVDQPWYHICTDTPPRYGGTLIMSGAPGAVTGNNWFQHSPRNDFIFNQLLDLDVDGETLHPDLATSWEISDDGLVYTLKLREGVVFHDGEPFTAEDVKYTLEMFYHPDTGASHARLFGMDSIVGAADFETGEADEISGIVAVDDYTIEITLNEPRSNFLDGLRGFNIWPKHALEGIPFIELRDSQYAVTNPIGTGPFKMDELQPDQFLSLVAFEDYYAGRPYLDKIIFRIGLTGASVMAALEAGEIHVGGLALGPDYDRLVQNPDIALVGGAVAGGLNVHANRHRERWQDVRVLKALMYALDREAISEAYYGDLAQVMHINMTNEEFVSPNLVRYEYNPDLARQLLEEAGWDSSQPVDFVTYYTSDLDKRIHAAMQQQWQEVGVNVELIYLDSPAWIERVFEQDDFDLAYGCCGWNDPAYLTAHGCDQSWPSGRNTGHYCNEEFDSIVAQAIVEPDANVRLGLWHRATEIYADELGSLPMFQPIRYQAIRSNVCNYHNHQIAEPQPETFPAIWYLAGE